MTNKVSLTNLVNLQNETTAVNAINTNNATIATAFDNTLSRDGTSPNQMQSSLDMNSNQILNLPAPSTMNSPARLADVVTNPTVILPGTGTSGHVVPFLDGNNTWSGTDTFNGNVYFKSGSPWVDVKAFGATGDGNTDDTAAIQAAINSLGFRGGTVFLPPATYAVLSGPLMVTENVNLVGSGGPAGIGTVLQSWHVDNSIIRMVGGTNSVQNMQIFGKGLNGDTGTFGGTHNTLNVEGVAGLVSNVLVWGGLHPMQVSGTDNMIVNVYPDYSYDTTGASVFSTGANWYIRGKLDGTGSGLPITNTRPYPAWTALTTYTAGTAVTTAGHVITCKTSGTSGASAPALRNNGIDMVDGTAVWQWECPVTSYAYRQTGGGVQENHFTQCDFSGNYLRGVSIESSDNAITVISDSVLSHGLTATTGSGWTSLHNCELAGIIDVVAGYSGPVTISNNSGVGAPFAINIGANVNNFNITNNHMVGGTITVAAGTSDHYVISGNVSATLVDGGTGIHKYTTGNVT